MRLASSALGLALALAPDLALACPNCRIGQEVRARFVTDAFWLHLGMALLPLVVLGAIAAALHRIGRPPAGRLQER